MVMHIGGWVIFAVGVLFLTLTTGVLVMQNRFFFQSPAFATIVLAFILKRTSEESLAIN